jgi:hypothetical protein
VVVLEGFFCPEAEEIEWSGLGNRTIRFGSHREPVQTSVLVFVFTSETLSCSVATISDFLSTLGFASPLAEDTLLGPV